MKTMLRQRVWIGSVLVACSLTSSWSSAAEVATSPYGPNDEIGVPNTLTAAQSLAVLQRVESGKVYDLSVNYFVGMPGLNDLGMGDPPYHFWMTHTPSGVKVEKLTPAGGAGDLALYDDAFIMSTHSGTHFDSLNHLGYGDKIFNGYEASRLSATKGGRKRAPIKFRRLSRAAFS